MHTQFGLVMGPTRSAAFTCGVHWITRTCTHTQDLAINYVSPPTLPHEIRSRGSSPETTKSKLLKLHWKLSLQRTLIAYDTRIWHFTCGTRVDTIQYRSRYRAQDDKIHSRYNAKIKDMAFSYFMGKEKRIWTKQQFLFEFF